MLAGRPRGDTLAVDTWVMSCRAFSRRVEYACLAVLFDTFAATEIAFDFQPTPRNGPIQEFFAGLLGHPPGSDPPSPRRSLMPGAPRSTTASSDPCRPDLESRLIKCFAATFASLEPEEIPRADASSLPEWDSLASMTLVALIEEEFGMHDHPLGYHETDVILKYIRSYKW